MERSLGFLLNFAISFMFLFILKILICSNSCLKFLKSYIEPCNAVNSYYILKGLETFNSCFVNKYGDMVMVIVIVMLFSLSLCSLIRSRL